MKKTYFYGLMGALALLSASCSDVLNEQPRSNLTPDFFRTRQGIEGGLTAVYSHMRYFYGPVGNLYRGTVGTDECTWGNSQDGGGKDIDTYGTAITPQTPTLSDIWNRSFTYINTCNGIISIGQENHMAPSLLAEAKFFRAHDYFLLVQNYGGVPLDLGAGPLAFNTSPVRTSQRNSVPEVYAVILQDLEEAVTELPEMPRLTGSVTKTAARFFLSKAYLTYAWWLKRNSMHDPKGKSPETYYQQAYDVAMEAINNPGIFGLMETFYDVNLAANDRNKEIILYADHNEDPTFSESGNPTYTDTGSKEQGMKENRSNFAITCNFEQAAGGVVKDVIRRLATQDLGRPWTRVAPTSGALLNTFADKMYDSRYDGTFVTTYYANWNERGDADETKEGANNMTLRPGDVAWKFLDDDTELPNLTLVGDGYSLPDKPYAVWTPSTINRVRYPGLWKFGPDRADKAGAFNAPSTRPFPIAKFSELYFLAAEAAVQGAVTQPGFGARELVNVIRARAGKWRWDNNNHTEKQADYSAEMVTTTPVEITIDYILAERSRELFAEGGRWYDLVRTGKLKELAGKYYICEVTPAVEPVASEHTRNIQDHHYLRPIPQSQLDGMEVEQLDKDNYQNPGYN
ncbi:MAG: RagB/SusD family nutrient uptake outer membrane protein [Tannerellaceae bacterium]|jgi:hypothetical protein|nr:RagB/SusD family nutrient uptake outer membrane protein [Tannerellaceae bacterium]